MVLQCSSSCQKRDFVRSFYEMKNCVLSMIGFQNIIHRRRGKLWESFSRFGAWWNIPPTPPAGTERQPWRGMNRGFAAASIHVFWSSFAVSRWEESQIVCREIHPRGHGLGSGAGLWKDFIRVDQRHEIGAYLVSWCDRQNLSYIKLLPNKTMKRIVHQDKH